MSNDLGVSWEDFAAQAIATVPELSDGLFRTDDGTLLVDPQMSPADGDLSTVEQMAQFEFCLKYNGKPLRTQIVVAPSAESAVLTVEMYVRLLNRVAPSLGAQPLFSASPGPC